MLSECSDRQKVLEWRDSHVLQQRTKLGRLCDGKRENGFPIFAFLRRLLLLGAIVTLVLEEVIRSAQLEGNTSDSCT